MNQLEGKIAIVTGAAGGIGAATARRFIKEGARVVLVDREQAPLEAIAAALNPELSATCTADVSSEDDIDRLFAFTESRFGKPDVIFANAGIEGRVCPLVEYPTAEFERVLAVNVKGVWLTIRAAARSLGAGRGGSIIATSSVAGLVGAGGLSAYVASKHAVIGIVKSAALELGPMGIRVNAINPGPIENRMMRSIEVQSSPEAPENVKHGFESRVALGRYGTNEEIANLALFLAGDQSTYCTGGVFVADGGYTAA